MGIRNIFVSGIEISCSNESEILRFGGPWKGDISIGEELISKDCLIDNLLYQKRSNLLFFVKYHHLNAFQWFTLNFYDLKAKTNFEFYHEFGMLYLKDFISENEIHVYESFNDKAGNNFYFKLDEEEFHLLY